MTTAPLFETITPNRRRWSLIALAIGGFGIGAGEFAAMGLLPQFASDLLPGLYAADPLHEAANAQAGWLISAYALGVVLGAPTIGTMVGRFPKKTVALWLVGALLVGTLLSAILPSFGLVLTARVIAGLPHGAYFGIAALIAADLMGPGKQGRGTALVLSGLTIANTVGVPLITFVGQAYGWRAAYGIVVVAFALTFVAVLAIVPQVPGDPNSTVRRELGALRLPQVWFSLGIGAIGFGGLFAVYSFISPMITEVTGSPEWVVPIALVLVGAGMFVGNLVGGWLADRGLDRGLAFGFAAMAVAMVLLAFALGWLWTALPAFFLFGATTSVAVPMIQMRLILVAHESRTFAAAINHSALNLGNALGALLGSVVVAQGLGYVAPVWVGLGLIVLGATLLGIARLAARDEDRALTGSHPVVPPSVATGGIPTV